MGEELSDWEKGLRGFEAVLSPPLFLLSSLLASKVAPPSDRDSTPSSEQIMQARYHLLIAGGTALAIVGAPTMYAYSKTKKGRKKRALSDKELMLGRSLENASLAATGLLATALATPAIGTAIAYVGVQKLEDAQLISRGLGDAAQGLMTVAAAGPAIGGVLGGVTSAFTKAK